MTDVEIKFEREGLDGVVAVGTYLIDAMRRIGVKLDPECEPKVGEHHCEITIQKGLENLSPMTKAETEHFAGSGRKDNVRLACHAKIEKAGDVVVMTKEKTAEQESKDHDRTEEYRKEFTELPLEKKIASLIQLETIALSETFSFIINSPFMIFEKVGDVMAEFGLKMEKEAKAAERPAEHKESNGAGEAEPKKRSTRPKAGGGKKVKDA